MTDPTRPIPADWPLVVVDDIDDTHVRFVAEEPTEGLHPIVVVPLADCPEGIVFEEGAAYRVQVQHRRWQWQTLVADEETTRRIQEETEAARAALLARQPDDVRPLPPIDRTGDHLRADYLPLTANDPADEAPEA